MEEVSQFNGVGLIDKEARNQIQDINKKIALENVESATNFTSSDEVSIKQNGTIKRGKLSDLLATHIVQANIDNIDSKSIITSNINVDTITAEYIEDSSHTKYLKESDVSSKYDENSESSVNSKAIKEALDNLSKVTKTGSYYDIKDAPTSLPASNTTSEYKSNGIEPINGVAVFKAFESYKGKPFGLATLNEDGIVPSSQLPSYVSDISEYNTKEEFPTFGEVGKIYISLNDNITYRWSGNNYVEISKSLAIGETSETAFRGDLGKISYRHSTDPQILKTNTNIGLYKLSASDEGHISGLEKVTKEDIINLGIPSQNTTYELASTESDGLLSKEDKQKLDGIKEHIKETISKIKVEKTNGQGYISSISQKEGIVTPTYTDWPIFNQNTTGSSGSCIGNSATATKATYDSDGNKFTTTYLRHYNTSLVDMGYTPRSEIPLDTFINDCKVKFGDNCVIFFEKDDNKSAYIEDSNGNKTELISGYTLYFNKCNQNGDTYWMTSSGLLMSTLNNNIYYLNVSIPNGTTNNSSRSSISKILKNTDLLSVYNENESSPISNAAIRSAIHSLRTSQSSGQGYISAVKQENGIVTPTYTDWPIFNQNTTGSSGSCTGNSATATKADFPKGFKSFNGYTTWGNKTGYTLAEWKAENGGSIEWRADCPNEHTISLKTTGRVYVNSDKAAMGMSYTDNKWQMGSPDGNTEDFILTTEKGILPIPDISSLGNADNYFQQIYAREIYCDNIKGRITNANLAVKAESLDERELKVNLVNTDKTTFNGTKDTEISIKGILQTKNGGLGTSSLKEFIKEAAANLDRESSIPNETDFFISKSSGSSYYVRKSFESLWDYIKLKIADELGMTIETSDKSTYAGLSAKAVADSKGNEITANYTRKYVTTLHYMGYGINEQIEVKDFLLRCKDLFDSNAIIYFTKDSNTAAYITDGVHNTERISGYTLFLGNSGGLLVGTSDSHKVYQLSYKDDEQYLGQIIQDIDFSSVYDTNSDLPVNSKAIEAAIKTLKANKSSGEGYISAIEQNNGIVTPTYNKWPIFNQNTTGSSGSCTGNSATATQADYPKGFASRTQGSDIDDITTWNTKSNGTVDWKDNNPSDNKVSMAINGRVYVNSDKAVMGMSYNKYWGMGNPDGQEVDYLRTTKYGIIPNEPDSLGKGHSALGNPEWHFANAYINDIYGNLHGSAENCIGNSATASRLKTPISLNVNLSSTQDKTFDASEDTSLSVKGILSISNGGTGTSSIKEAIDNFSKGLELNNIPLKDNSEYWAQVDGNYTRKSFSTVWEYIKNHLQEEGITKELYEGVSKKTISDKLGNDITTSYTRKYNVTMASMGYQIGSYIPVSLFMNDCFKKFEKNAIVNFSLDNNSSAFITDGVTNTESISGYTLILGDNDGKNGTAMLLGIAKKSKSYQLSIIEGVGNIKTFIQEIAFDSIYNPNGTLAVNGKAIKDALSTLNADKTRGEGYISAIEQNNGIVTPTYTNWPIFNQNTTGSSGSCTGNSATATQADYPKGFTGQNNVKPINYSNDVITNWVYEDKTAISYIKENDGVSMSTSGRLYIKDNHAVLGTTLKDSIWQMSSPDGDNSPFIQTTNKGLLAVHNTSSLGDSEHIFKSAYINSIYGNVTGRLYGASDECLGNAATANHLKEPKKYYTALSSNTLTDIDFSTDKKGIPVQGVLGINNGGTGGSTAEEGITNLVNALSLDDSTPTDNDTYMSQGIGGKYKRKAYSSLWSYIKNKLFSAIGLTDTQYNGTASKAVSDENGKTFKEYYLRTDGTSKMSSTLIVKDSISFTTTNIGNESGNFVLGNTKDFKTGTVRVNNNLQVQGSTELSEVSIKKSLNVEGESNFADVNITGILNSLHPLTINNKEVVHDMRSLNNLIPHLNGYSPNNYTDNVQGYFQLGNILIKVGQSKGTESGINDVVFDDKIPFVNAPIVISQPTLGVTSDKSTEPTAMSSYTCNITNKGFRVVSTKGISNSWIAIGSCSI